MPKPKRTATDSIQKLAARVDQLTSAKSCPRLLHVFLPGSPAAGTPGCAECAKVKEQQDAWAKANPPAPAPRPPTASPSASASTRTSMVNDEPTFAEHHAASADD